MFFESNRSKSEMLLECLENGTYAHVEEWPVCLQGFCKLEIVLTLFTKSKHNFKKNCCGSGRKSSDIPSPDVSCPLPPEIPTNNDYQQLEEAQV